MNKVIAFMGSIGGDMSPEYKLVFFALFVVLFALKVVLAAVQKRKG